MIYILLGAFPAGVLFSGYLDSNIPVFIISVISLFVLSFCTLRKTSAKTLILTAIIFSFIFASGYKYFDYTIDRLIKTNNDFLRNKGDSISGTICEDVQSSYSSTDFILKTDDNLRIKVTYKGINEILPGDRIKIDKAEVKAVKHDTALFSKNVGAYVECESDSLSFLCTDKSYLYKRYFHTVRKNTFYTLLKYLHYDEAGFLYSVVSSDKAYISNDKYERFVNSGIVHLCTVSGFHFSFLCMFLTVILVPFIKSYRKRIIISLFLATLFLMYTGFEISVVRAYIIFFIVRTCDLFYIDKPGIKKIFLIVLCVFVAKNPLVIYDLSFILTFSNLIGLLFLYPEIARIFKTGNKPIKDYFSMMAGVSIAVISIGYSLFGHITIWLFIANFLVGNIVGPLMVIVLLICIFDFVFNPIGNLLALVCAFGAKYIFLVTDAVAKLPKLRATFPLSMTVCAFVIAFFYFFLKSVKKKKYRQTKLPIAACICLCMAMVTYFYQFNDDNAYISYIGDSLSVDIENKHKHYVIGSFEDIYYNSYKSALKQNESVEVLMITDSDIDTDRFLEFIGNYTVRNIIATKSVSEKIRDFGINICDNMSYKDSFIDMSYDKKAEFIIKEERFVIPPDIRYVAYNCETERDCTFIFTDYGNKNYRLLLEKLDFDKSINPIIKSKGYQKLICTDSNSVITVSKKDDITID